MRDSDRRLSLIEKVLSRYLPPKTAYPREVHQAMRYAALGGGKRFRPMLVLAACGAVGGGPEKALLPACAVEFIHSYSLVHDDLPALDDDAVRRGKPTCHRKFGEAIAILAGDALLTQAFALLAQVKPVEKAILLIRELAEAAGTKGLIGGQVVDILFAENGARKALSAATLNYISQHKTGRLIEASAVLGALVGTESKTKQERIRRFGRSLGLAFQVVDDIMDGDGYLRLMRPKQARQRARSLILMARREVLPFGRQGEGLLGLADFLLSKVS